MPEPAPSRSAHHHAHHTYPTWHTSTPNPHPTHPCLKQLETYRRTCELAPKPRTHEATAREGRARGKRGSAARSAGSAAARIRSARPAAARGGTRPRAAPAASGLHGGLLLGTFRLAVSGPEIGRASCRERVWVW